MCVYVVVSVKPNPFQHWKQIPKTKNKTSTNKHKRITKFHAGGNPMQRRHGGKWDLRDGTGPAPYYLGISEEDLRPSQPGMAS